MGEYDRIKPKTATAARRSQDSGNSSGAQEYSSAVKRSSASRQIVRAPFEWLIFGLASLLVCYLPVLISKSFVSYLLTFAIAILATLFSVLALLEDQRRMRAPAYSLNRNFRKFGATLYGLSTVAVLSVIILVGLRAATQ